MRHNFRFHPSRFEEMLPNIAAFALGIGIAWLQKWQTVELAWSLWLSSLVVGYLSIFSTIVAGVYIGYYANERRKYPFSYRSQLLGRLFYALFLVGFFSLHFSGYHLGQAMILNSVLPLETSPQNAFDYNFINPLSVWKLAVEYVVPLYGLFLIPVIITERKSIFGALIRARMAIRRGEKPEDPFARQGQIRTTDTKSPLLLSSFFIAPYRNAMRLQLLIFFFVSGITRTIDTMYVMVFIYTVYFFPWSAFFYSQESGIGDDTRRTNALNR